MFQKIDKARTFPEIEKDILEFWQENKSFQKSLDNRKKAKAFEFFDGPPFATGLPHYGNLLAGTLKDIVPRYWTMRGCRVERRFGWDCHGLPIESLIQNELNLATVKDIKAYGVGKFNEACRARVLQYTREWERIVGRMGRWVDFKNDYKTMDLSFMESVWWVFKQCYDRGLIYQDYRIQPYSPALATPLSNFEVNQGYQDRQDPSITLTFPLHGEAGALLVWTTTPWTLPSNLAIALNPDMAYLLVEHEGQKYWIGEPRRDAYFSDNVKVLSRKSGRELAGRKYTPLFTHAPLQSANQYTLVLGDFVTAGDGTGAVHMAPSFGEDDFVLGKKLGLGLFDPLDEEGKFTDLVPEWKGQGAKDSEKTIIKHLKEAGRIFKHETLVHSYPHCWRTGVPLLYRAIKTWFLGVERPVKSPSGEVKSLKQWMIEANRTINWVPSHIRDGRFGHWLEGARDWNLSRNRFWGTPIPVWIADDGEKLCVGSVKELEALTGKKVDDLHMHIVDTLEVRRQGKLYRRTPEVLDCWFESGAMPYAQNHYPFENRERVEKNFPGDFIAEGLDQTRGWFYTLTVLGAALFQGPAFKNVIVNGIILAEDGQKMSKRLKNYPDPEVVLDQLGADALRMFLINSPAVRAEDLRFSESGVREILRTVIIPFWNAYNFFVEYAVTDQFDPRTHRIESGHELDRWILSVQQSLIAEVNAQMASYNLYRVVPALVTFIDDLTNWYIRRSRPRFWSSAADHPDEKKEAHSTLYRVLTTFTQMLAPVLPFVTEEIYQNLARPVFKGAAPSVHLCDYPEADPALTDKALESRMALVRTVVGLGNALRSEHKLKNRQPLQTVTVVTRDREAGQTLAQYRTLILDELNVKALEISDAEEKVVELSIKPNFRVLGKKFGREMPAAAKAISALGAQSIQALAAGGFIEVLGKPVGLTEVEIERKPKAGTVLATREGLTVLLDAALTPELVLECHALEIKNRVNTMRKEAGLDKEDRIALHFSTPSGDLRRVILQDFHAFLKAETLSVEIEEGGLEGQPERKSWQVNGEEVVIAIRKIK